MAEQNPIKYSDLISPDDSIENLIKQLEQLNEAYTGMAESVRTQAASVAASMRSVSGATTQGQQATRNAATEADKLAKAYQNLAFARSETARKIAELNEAKKLENRITKLQILLNNSEEGSYAHLSAQYALNKMQLNQLTAAERQNLPHAKKLEEETKAIYEQMKKLQEATGKYSLNVGNYTNSITSAIGINTRWYQGLQEIGAMFEGGFKQGVEAATEAVGAFGKKLLALLMNPIVAILAAVTAAFMALAKGISTSEENMNALNRIMAPFHRIAEACLGVVQDLATQVLRLVEGSEQYATILTRWLEHLPKVGTAFTVLNAVLDKHNDKLRESVELEREKQSLQKDGRKLTAKEAKTQYEIAVLRRKANETDDPKIRMAYLNKAIKKEREMSANRVTYLQRELAVMKEEASWNQTDSKTLDAIAQKEAEIWNARTQAETRSLRMVRQIATAERQMNKGTGGSTSKVGGTSVDTAKKELEETRKIEDAKIALIEDAGIRERMTVIATYDRKIEDARRAYGQETELAVLYEQQKQQKLAELVEKANKEQQDKEKKDLDARLKALDDMNRKRENAVRNAEKAINDQYNLSMSAAELEDNENKKTDMRLQAEKKRMQALLDLYEKDGQILSDAEVQALKNSIKAVDKEIEKNKGKRDIYDLLGFSQEQKEASKEAFSMAIESLQNYMSAWVEAAEQKTQLADKEVERTKSVLDSEIEARNKGYAANVALAQKEYDNARKNQQKALQEQRRAQKAQEAVQTAEQVSSLITATANIWRAFTGMGPWGIALAVAATALMFGSFAAAKVKAASVAGSGSDEEYGEGTVELLQGGSHQSGNDIDLGRKKNGQRRRAEGGEYFAVINKRNSRRYRNLIPEVINALNDGTFAQKYHRAYDDGGLSVSVQTQNADLRGLSSDVRLIREQGETRSSFDRNGNEVVQYKNLRRIIKNG